MAKKFEELLEFIVNGEQKKAEELFHELVVAKSREIYEGLYEQELADIDLEEASDDEEEDMDEAAKHDDEEDEKMDEASYDDEEDMDESSEIEEIGGDPSDDMMSDVSADEEDEDEGDEPVTKSDLESALDELKAEFEKLMGGDDMGDDMDMGGDDDMGMGGDDEKKEMFAPAFEEEIEEIDLTPAEQMREYVEKIGDAYKGGKVASSSEAGGTNTKSIVAGKNDMGGTVKNIAQGGVGSEKGTAGGLLNPSTKEHNAGNVNVPGSKSATKLASVAKGHGAEKKGAGEDAQNKKSIIGSR